MVAPTAVVKENVLPTEEDEESDFRSDVLLRLVMINPTETEIPSDAAQTEMHIDEESRPRFPPSTQTITSSKSQIRRITIPPHRLTPLRNQWAKIYPPLVEHLNLQVRMNTKTKQVEMRTSKHTQEGGSALQKGADFLRAFTLGFDVDVLSNLNAFY